MDAGEGVFASAEVVRWLVGVCRVDGRVKGKLGLPSSFADGDDSVAVGLEEFGHAQAHVSD